MNSRRNFIKKAGGGLAAAAIAPQLYANSIQNGKIIIGIIGAENSHTIGFGKMFNTDKKFPGMEVKYVWGETDEFAKRAMERGNIPNQVKDQAEMMGKIDALIVDHRHAKYHLDAAWPFVKAGIPTFIDKPFCYRAEKGKEFLQMAREVGTPVTSYSSIAHSAATFDIKKQVEEMGDIYQVNRFFQGCDVFNHPIVDFYLHRLPGVVMNSFDYLLCIHFRYSKKKENCKCCVDFCLD